MRPRRRFASTVLIAGALLLEQALPAEEGAYRYWYTGLKLLFRMDGKLFLGPSDLSDPRNIVIREDLEIHVAYG